MKTKEELLKIYGAYAPYKLHILHTEKKMALIVSGCYFNENSEENIQLKLLNWEIKVNSDEVKPILYSMDYLTKEIEYKGERFYPYEKLHLCFSDVTNLLNEDLWIGQWWDYEKVCKLIEWHFNVFGLSDSEYIKKETLNK